MTDNTWISLRQFIDHAVAKTGYDQIDPISQHLLEWIVARHDESPATPIYIQTLVLKSGIASPATIFKCAATLQRKKMISITIDTADARRKIIEPTAKAREHFRELNQLTISWARKTS